MKLIVVFMLLFSLKLLAGPVWYPLPAEAYKFREQYPEAQRLLFAFDYGHALVYEKLLLNKGAINDPKVFERQLLDEVLSILKNPPNVKVDESDIAPQYVYTFPLMVTVFDWSHLLHQFIYDILATTNDRGPALTKRVQQLYSYYKDNKQMAITDVCKSMLFMDGHYFSKDFRRSYPSFNLLIWSYHWFQIRLYEALLKPTKKERDLEVEKTVKEFWLLISDLPDSAEFDMMPETKKVAPTFYKLFPLISATFDTNHMMHDIVSDILSSKKVAKEDFKKLGMIYARMAMDPQSFKSNLCGGSQ